MIYAYLAAILVALGAYGGYHFTAAHYDHTIAAMKAAQTEAIEAQEVKDAKVSQGAVDALNTELDAVRVAAASSSRVLCYSTPKNPVRQVPVPSRTSPSATSTGSLPSLPEGTGSGDISSGLQALAVAADIVSARDRACIEWATEK